MNQGGEASARPLDTLLEGSVGVSVKGIGGERNDILLKRIGGGEILLTFLQT